MAQIIAGTEEVVEVLIVLHHAVLFVSYRTALQSVVLSRQQYRTLLVLPVANLTVANNDVCLWHEEVLL